MNISIDRQIELIQTEVGELKEITIDIFRQHLQMQNTITHLEQTLKRMENIRETTRNVKNESGYLTNTLFDFDKSFSKETNLIVSSQI